jgi:hypothetical protein
VSAPCNMAADFIEVKLHGLSVGEWQRESGSLATRRTDGAEQICALIALVGGLAGPRAAPSPLPNDTILLPYTSFVLEPDLDRFAFGQVGQMGVQRAREVFL